MGGQGGHGQVRVPGRPRGAARLVTRQFRRDPWVSVLLAVVVLVVSLLATAWPRLVLDMNSRQVPYVMDELSSLRRDVSAAASTWGFPPFAEGGESADGQPRVDAPDGVGYWALALAQLNEVRDAQPEPLRSALREGNLHADLSVPATGVAPPGSAVGGLQLTLRIDPALREHADLVRGEWPEAMANFEAGGSAPSLLAHDPSRPLPDLEGLELIQVVLLDEAAQQLNWRVGERWGAMQLTGTYVPRDPGDPRWAHAANSTALGRISSQGGEIATAAGYLAPDSTGAVDTRPVELRLRFVLPLEAAGVRGDQVSNLVRALEQLASSQSVLLSAGYAGPGSGPVTVSLTTEALPSLQQLLSQQQATASLLAVLAAGPIGVTLAVLLLGTRLIHGRRAGAVGLAVARGASRQQVRGVLAVEGLLLGVPAALVGYLVAGRLFPTPTGPGEVIVAVAVGLLPAAALMVTGGGGTVREQRRDLRARTGGRVRAVAEVALLVIAGLAVWRLMTRGLVGLAAEPAAPADSRVQSEAVGVGASEAVGATVQVAGGVDPLMAATPVLLALAACVITMRLYPVPVRLMVAVLRRGRKLSGFLGAVRALRDPGAGLLPALAVILGVAVAVSSVVLASTVTAGASAAVWESAGAQIRASGPTMGLDERRALRAIDGVAAVATAREISQQTALSGGLSADGVRVVVVDDEMEQVSADAGPLPPLPAELFEVRSPTPVLTVGALTAERGSGHLRHFGEVEVVGHRATLPGVRTRGATLVMSVSNWESVKARVSSGNAALVSLTGAVPADEVTAQVAAAVPTALVETPELREESFLRAPVTSGLLNAFLVVVVVSAVLTTLTLLLAHHMGARERARMLSVLRTLGMAPRQGRTLTAWEFGPLVATALVVGAATGALVSWLLVHAVDLTGLTGGAAQPDLSVDGALLAGVLGAVVVTVALAITVTSILASRSDLAQQLRIGDEP